MKLFTIFFSILFFLTSLSGEETELVEIRKEFKFYKEKIIDLEKKLKKLNELAKMLKEQNEMMQTTRERLSLLEGALNDLSLERKEEKEKLSQIEKYLQEEKSTLTKINELLNEQGNKQIELTKEIEEIKEKIKKLEENLAIFAQGVNELRMKKVETSSTERELHLEPTWGAPLALGIAVFTFLLIVF